MFEDMRVGTLAELSAFIATMETSALYRSEIVDKKRKRTVEKRMGREIENGKRRMERSKGKGRKESGERRKK